MNASAAQWILATFLVLHLTLATGQMQRSRPVSDPVRQSLSLEAGLGGGTVGFEVLAGAEYAVNMLMIDLSYVYAPHVGRGAGVAEASEAQIWALATGIRWSLAEADLRVAVRLSYRTLEQTRTSTRTATGVDILGDRYQYEEVYTAGTRTSGSAGIGLEATAFLPLTGSVALGFQGGRDLTRYGRSSFLRMLIALRWTN